jgi:hypothetical protein
VLAKSFQTDISAFDHMPGSELYIFPGGARRPYRFLPLRMLIHQ